MKKLIYCYLVDESKVRNYLINWGVNFKERDGVFKLDFLEVKVVFNKLSEKLIIYIIGWNEVKLKVYFKMECGIVNMVCYLSNV